jgi:hypothetical protein
MSSTSSHAAYLQQVDLPRNFYYHRGIAIRLLNERLERGDHDEGTINTVCVFAQQEVYTSSSGERAKLMGANRPSKVGLEPLKRISQGSCSSSRLQAA